MKKICNLTSDEINELVEGVREGFREVQFFDRFLSAFIFDVRARATSPVDLFLSILEKRVDNLTTIEPLADFLANDDEYSNKIRHEWASLMRKNRLHGHILASLTALCVEAYLQNGKFFSKGIGSNDLVRISDSARWEIKGSRSNSMRFTINQSHKDVDATTFLVYSGHAEKNIVYGIYYLCGCDKYFSPRKPGQNLRRLLSEYEDQMVKLYPSG
ncbi:MAG: hypothetical protein ABFD64_03690 [Armatimonadota bacterium]